MGVKRILLYIVGAVAIISQFARIFSSKTHMNGQNVLLVTAHPDDETMFFGPTIRHAVNNNNTLHFLVLSNGGADGLGAKRTEEMHAVAPLLGAREENVLVINEPKLQDGDDWSPQDVAKQVQQFLSKQDIDTVITFDADGVSGHINHKKVHEGTVIAAREHAQQSKKLSLLTLVSVPLWRKYLFTVDSILSRLMHNNVHYTLISGSIDYSVVKRALVKAHRSQMVWYRHLWTMFSRYMVVNDLREIDMGQGLTSRAFYGQERGANSAIVNQGPRGSNIKTSVERPSPTAKTPRPVTRQKPAKTEL